MECIGPEISLWKQSMDHIEIGKQLNAFKSASSPQDPKFIT